MFCAIARFVAAKRGGTPGTAPANALRQCGQNPRPTVQWTVRSLGGGMSRTSRPSGATRTSVAPQSGLRASLPQPRGLVRVLPEVDLRRRRVLPERRLPRVAHLGPQARLEVRDAGLEADVLLLQLRHPPDGPCVLRAEAARGLALSPHPPPRAATRSGARPPPRGGPRAAFRSRPPCASPPRRGRARAGICPCRRHGR